MNCLSLLSFEDLHIYSQNNHPNQEVLKSFLSKPLLRRVLKQVSRWTDCNKFYSRIRTIVLSSIWQYSEVAPSRSGTVEPNAFRFKSGGMAAINWKIEQIASFNFKFILKFFEGVRNLPFELIKSLLKVTPWSYHCFQKTPFLSILILLLFQRMGSLFLSYSEISLVLGNNLIIHGRIKVDCCQELKCCSCT